jgi:hypothetical protein
MIAVPNDLVNPTVAVPPLPLHHLPKDQGRDNFGISRFHVGCHYCRYARHFRSRTGGAFEQIYSTHASILFGKLRTDLTRLDHHVYIEQSDDIQVQSG